MTGSWRNRSIQILFFLALVSMSFAIDIDNCQALDTAGTTYVLTTSPAQNASTCFNITAENITLDCAGFSITGNNSNSTYGVYSTQLNTTIQNCQISNFSTGIGINGATRSTVRNNTIITNSISASTTAITATSLAGNNTILGNNLTSNRWISDSNGSNNYNDSNSGNIYYFTNGTGAWNVFDIYNNGSSNWAQYGSDRPFNATTVGGNWSGSGQDWHPYVGTAILSVSILPPFGGSYSKTGIPYLVEALDGNCSFSIYVQANDTGNSIWNRTVNLTQYDFYNNTPLNSIVYNYVNGAVDVVNFTFNQSGYTKYNATATLNGVYTNSTSTEALEFVGVSFCNGGVGMGISGTGGAIIFIALYILVGILWAARVNRVLTIWLVIGLTMFSTGYAYDIAKTQTTDAASLFYALLMLSMFAFVLFTLFIGIDLTLFFTAGIFKRKHRSVLMGGMRTVEESGQYD